MNNLIIIPSTKHDDIHQGLSKAGVSSAHFTNGTYAYPAEMILGTTLAGFQYLSDNIVEKQDAFIIAVNSDASMANIMDEKKASTEERDALEGQLVRAKKVAKPLAEKHPDQKVIVLFYDEATPTPLYDALAEGQDIDLKSLHKWGYGTNPDAPKIEGAHNFGRVFGFPLPNDKKPVCYNITAHEDQSGVVEVVKLSETSNTRGVPYIALPENKM